MFCFSSNNLDDINSVPFEAGEKDTRDLGLDGVFRRVLRFPPPLTNSWSRISHNMAEKEGDEKSEIPNSVYSNRE